MTHLHETDRPKGSRTAALLVVTAVALVGFDGGTFDPCADAGDPCCTTAVAGAPVRALEGCNGPAPGPQPDNHLGGACYSLIDPDGGYMGTCVDGAWCAAPEVGDVGICVAECPSIPTFSGAVITGGCPSGNRCWNMGFFPHDEWCFPDCVADTDCSTGYCTYERRCQPYASWMLDGGLDAAVLIPDGGVGDLGADLGPHDAAAADAGALPDAGVELDAAVDALPPADADGSDAGRPVDGSEDAAPDAAASPHGGGGCCATVGTRSSGLGPLSVSVALLVVLALRKRRR